MENTLIDIFSKHKNHLELENILQKTKRVFVKGMQTSALSFFVSSDKRLNSSPTIIIADNQEDAAYCYNDFQSAETRREVFYYPFSHKHSVLKTDDVNEISPESLLSKTEVLDKISKLKNYVLITYPEAAAENVICQKELEKNTLTLKTGDKLSTDFIVEVENVPVKELRISESGYF